MAPTQFLFFDFSKFNRFTGGYPEIKQEIAEAFIRQTPAILKELEVLARNENTKGLELLLHKLKSSAGVFCKDALYDEMADIEKELTSRPVSEARIDKVIKDVKVLLTEIKATLLGKK